NDKLVIGIGVKQSTSPLFVKACDEFIYFRGADRIEEAGAPRPTGASSRQSASGEQAPAKRARAVPAIARRAFANLPAPATGPLNPSIIKEPVVRQQPDFDEREHGFSSFSRLLEAMEKEGLLAMQQQGRQIYVVSPEAAPAKASGDEAGATDDDTAF